MKIKLILKKIIPSSEEATGRRFFVLPEEPSSGEVAERIFFGSFVLPEKLPEEVLPDEQFVLPEEQSYRKKFFDLVTFLEKKVLPDEQIVHPEELSSRRRNYFFKKLVLFSNFETRVVLSIHLIAGCTNNVAGCT